MEVGGFSLIFLEYQYFCSIIGHFLYFDKLIKWQREKILALKNRYLSKMSFGRQC